MTPTTLHLTPAELHRTIAAMERHGGHFCAALARAWYAADPRNKQRIEHAFGHLLEDFGPDSRFYTQNH